MRNAGLINHSVGWILHGCHRFDGVAGAPCAYANLISATKKGDLTPTNKTSPMFGAYNPANDFVATECIQCIPYSAKSAFRKFHG
ncbi:MAG: hypothetical protein RR315_08255, partial [Oscillospiraceae bacterium]